MIVMMMMMMMMMTLTKTMMIKLIIQLNKFLLSPQINDTVLLLIKRDLDWLTNGVLFK